MFLYWLWENSDKTKHYAGLRMANDDPRSFSGAKNGTKTIKYDKVVIQALG